MMESTIQSIITGCNTVMNVPCKIKATNKFDIYMQHVTKHHKFMRMIRAQYENKDLQKNLQIYKS